MTDDSAQARISRFWSTVAPDYEAHAGNVPASAEDAAQWMEAIRLLLPAARGAVLDVGTGTGFVARVEAALGHRVTAIDLAPGMLEVARDDARNAGLRIDFREGDAVAPPFDAASFDAVTSRHLLWTLREPERAFRNWRRLLRPGGRVVAIDGFWCAPAQEDDSEDAGPGPFEEHYTPATRAELPIMSMTAPEQVAELFRAAGFGHVAFAELDSLVVNGRTPYAIVARQPPTPSPPSVEGRGEGE